MYKGRLYIGECKCGVCIVYKGRLYIGECKSSSLVYVLCTREGKLNTICFV